MRNETTVTVVAPAEAVWKVLMDVEAWPALTLAERERFVWVAKGLGFRTTAGHEVLSEGGATQLRLTVDQSGPLAGAVHRLMNDLTDRYIGLEAAGIRRRAEEHA